MIVGICWLLACQLVGELIVRATGIAIPGPVVGMVLLLLVLQWLPSRPQRSITTTADGFLKHLQLFFVPAGVGVMVWFATIEEYALPLVVATVLSWAAGLTVVALIGRALARGRHG